MSSDPRQFRPQNRLLALEYATPRRHYTAVRHHRPWVGDLVFVLAFFTFTLAGLFAVTLIAHFLINLVLL
jgi:hypothetical protein